VSLMGRQRVLPLPIALPKTGRSGFLANNKWWPVFCLVKRQARNSPVLSELGRSQPWLQGAYVPAVPAHASATSAPAASSMLAMVDISSAIRPAPARSDESFSTR